MRKKARQEIANCIRYELAEGTHTYSMCTVCKQNAARSCKCWSCWLDMLVSGEDDQ